MIKANLVHLSYNMWLDRELKSSDNPGTKDLFYDPRLRFDEKLWRDIVTAMADAGMNMLVFDLADAFIYPSHPEIAIAGAWPVDKLKKELDFCRELGIEPIPKLNFSACHDAWLGEYSRKLSTPGYYALCSDLIKEAANAFEGPRFIHIGMDEETWQHQKKMLYAVIRQGELWWHDLNFLVNAAERAGSRAWVWSDVLWSCGKEVFSKNMPATVLQSNWYYDNVFPLPEPRNDIKAYHWLDEAGYDQVPTGSTWSCRENYAMTVDYCKKHLSPNLLKGYMMTSWRPTTENWRQADLEAIAAVKSVEH